MSEVCDCGADEMISLAPGCAICTGDLVQLWLQNPANCLRPLGGVHYLSCIERHSVPLITIQVDSPVLEHRAPLYVGTVHEIFLLLACPRTSKTSPACWRHDFPRPKQLFFFRPFFLVWSTRGRVSWKLSWKYCGADWSETVMKESFFEIMNRRLKVGRWESDELTYPE